MKSDRIGHRIVWFESVESTMDEARAFAAREPDSAGVVIAARRQTRGRGRHGNHWYMDADASLALSIILEPPPDPLRVSLTPLALGAALTLSLREHLGLAVSMKWPNDIVDPTRRKLAGLLVESQGLGQANPVVIAGIGLNLAQIHTDFPKELRLTSTSIAILRPDRPAPSPEEALAIVLSSCKTGWDALQSPADAPLESIWRATSADLGHRVQAQVADRKLAGKIEGFTVATGLAMRDDRGGTHYLRPEHVKNLRLANASEQY